MKKYLCGALSFIAFSFTPAIGGELTLRPKWQGFYSGIHASYATGEVEWTAFGNRGDVSGAAVGVALGYNWLATHQLLFGVEADVSAGQIAGTVDTPLGTANETSMLASLRGRVGLAVGNSLLYATGGFAWAQNRSFNTAEYTRPTGWVAGIGFEHALSAGWSVKLEYLHFDLEDSSTTLGATPLTLDLVKVGANYRFGSRL